MIKLMPGLILLTHHHRKLGWLKVIRCQVFLLMTLHFSILLLYLLFVLFVWFHLTALSKRFHLKAFFQRFAHSKEIAGNFQNSTNWNPPIFYCSFWARSRELVSKQRWADLPHHKNVPNSTEETPKVFPGQLRDPPAYPWSSKDTSYYELMY